jgi:hypothetical protein
VPIGVIGVAVAVICMAPQAEISLAECAVVELVEPTATPNDVAPAISLQGILEECRLPQAHQP